MSNCISWSKNGFIAYSTPSTSGNSLKLTYLERVDERSWQLAPSQNIEIKPSHELSSHKYPIDMVTWSNLSTDLAVSDIYGNFFIFLAGVGVIDNSESNNASVPNIGTSNGSNNMKPGASSSTSTSTGKNGTKTTVNSSEQSNSNVSYELTSYNHLEMIYRDLSTYTKSSFNSDLKSQNSIVAFKWLNVEKPYILNKPALKSTQNESPNSLFTYIYGVNQSSPIGITHPITTKQACVALRQNGYFQLYYQGEHKVEYHKIEHKLENQFVNYSNASIGFTKDKQIIVTVLDKMSTKIKTFTITIDWGHLVTSAVKQKSDPHYQTPPESKTSPTLSINYLHEMSPLPMEVEDVEEKDSDSDKMDLDSDIPSSKNEASDFSSGFNNVIGKLISIDLISPSPAINGSELEVLISYEFFANSNEITATHTTIFRYKIAESTKEISEDFIELGQRKNITSESSSNSSYTITFQDKITRPGLLQSLETSTVDSLIMAIYTSGDIDVFDRETMQIVNKSREKNATPDKIATFFDLDYKFPNLNKDSNLASLLIGISPNLSCIVYTDPSISDQLQIKMIEKSFENITPKEIYVTSVAFALRHAYCCYTNTCSDDLLALIQSDISKFKKLFEKTITDIKSVNIAINRLIDSIICESHKAISFQLDGFSKESVDKLLSNPPLQKLLSLQLVLGEFSGQNRVIKDIAWIVLNLRSISFGIMFSLSSIYRQISKKKPTEDTLNDSITRAECITSLMGSAQWLIDLMIFFNQELINLSMVTKKMNNSVTITNSVVLPVLLSKIPRLFLMYALSSMGKTNEILKKLHKDLEDCKKIHPPMKEAFNRYFTVYNSSPLNISQFEEFLRKCDAYITTEIAKEASARSKNYTIKLEQKLVCQGEVSGEVVKIADTLIKLYPAVMERDLNLADLYFYKVDWLAIGTSNELNLTQSSEQLESNFDFKLYNYPNRQNCIVPRLHLQGSQYIDGLRKIVIDVGDYFKPSVDNKAASGTNTGLKIRKCTRCRLISYVNDPLAFASSSTIGLWTMVFHRTCLCGSAWVNI